VRRYKQSLKAFTSRGYYKLKDWKFPSLILLCAVLENLVGVTFLSLPVLYKEGIMSLTRGIITFILILIVTLVIERFLYDQSK